MMRPKLFVGLNPDYEQRMVGVIEEDLESLEPGESTIPTSEEAIRTLLSNSTVGELKLVDIDSAILSDREELSSELNTSNDWLGFKVSQSLLDIEIAGSLKLFLASGSATSNSLVLLYDAYFFKNEAKYYLDNEKVFRVMKGVGVRIEILVSEIKAEFALNIASAAAAAEARLATSSYRIYGLGISNLSFGEGLPTEGKLTSKSLRLLAEGVKSGLRYVAENLNQAQAESIEQYVGSRSTSQPDNDSRSVLYAMQSINKGHSLESAQKNAKDLHFSVIEAVYSAIAHTYDRYTIPNEEAKIRAKNWINSTQE